jgi:uncharacterized membrane protein
MANTLLGTAARSAVGYDSPVGQTLNKFPYLPTNVSGVERWISGGVGACLAVCGFDGKGPGLFSTLAGGYLLYRAATGHCPGYQALGVSMSDATAPNSAIAAGHGTRVDHTVAINKPVAEVYRFWRDFENLPRFMTHLLDVDTTTDGRSRGRARGPLGMTVEWEAELVRDERNKVIAWRSLPGSDVDTAGSVHFRALPHERGTEVRVSLKYDPPAGQLGKAVAKLFGVAPDQQIRADLQELKTILESSSRPIKA